ncbi:hypothetical protein D3C75_677470 [compost metagenome]
MTPSLSTISVTTGAVSGVLSTVKVKAAVGSLTLPAGSVAVAVMFSVPFGNAVAGVIVHTPPVTRAVPSTVLPLYSVMVSPLIPVPWKVGVLSSVTPLVSNVCCSAPTLSSAESMVGAAGGSVSRVKLMVPEAGLLLPAASLSVTLTEWSGVVNGVPGVKLQVPSARTVVVPIGSPLSRIVMVSPAVPVPEKVGVVSLVLPLLAMVPSPRDTSSVTVGMPGVAGIEESTVNVKPADGRPTLPTGSVATAVSV